jgi:RimJ/RimL family protein N-acetyltransferase
MARNFVPSSYAAAVATLELVRWSAEDEPLLVRLLGDPAMMEHLGGPESAEQISARHHRYVAMDASAGRVFKIVDCETREPMGSVLYWEREWRDRTIWEIGWSVLPAFQGRGVAVAATAQAIEAARAMEKHRFVHAFPSVDNAPSNAICRKLGFKLLEALDFEYPKGHLMRCNDWQLDLFG